jgi:hypothetical protein
MKLALLFTINFLKTNSSIKFALGFKGLAA